MNALPLDRLGCHEVSPGKFQFGVALPGIDSSRGKLVVKIIHEKDQFLQEIQPLSIDMTCAADPDPDLRTLWSVEVTIDKAKAPAGSHWGQPGVYLYRYGFQPVGGDFIDDLTDPFGRQFGIGALSAFTLGYKPLQWEKSEAQWKTPAIQDLIVYEIHIKEFAGSLQAAPDRLDYLKDLGVNCIEIMPVQNIRESNDWGYATTGFFGVEAEYGTRADFQRFVQEAHRRGIACIMDVVYGHVGWTFMYARLYRELNIGDPFTGTYGAGKFSPGVDYNKDFPRRYFYTANLFWLEQFHVDGFRYDCTPDLWNGNALCKGYATLAYETYQSVKANLSKPYWSRFQGEANVINLVQVPEELDRPKDILRLTYSNATWQDVTLNAAKDLANGKPGAISAFGHALGATDFTVQETPNGDVIPKEPFQYISNHDQQRFLCNFNVIPPENCQNAVNEPGYDLLKQGDRSLWFKEQPYLIGLLTGKGVPFLWQGDEFGENYSMPGAGYGRIKFFRPVRWEYFYSSEGRQLLRLVRRLIQIRKNGNQFRRGQHYFFDVDYYRDRSLLVFSRQDQTRYSVVALNFGGADQNVTIRFERAGDYREEILGKDNLSNVAKDANTPVMIPSNYGKIWTTGS